MLKIEIKENKDGEGEIKINSKNTSVMEIFVVIKRLFDLVSEKTDTDLKKVKKYYKDFEKNADIEMSEPQEKSEE